MNITTHEKPRASIIIALATLGRALDEGDEIRITNLTRSATDTPFTLVMSKRVTLITGVEITVRMSSPSTAFATSGGDDDLELMIGRALLAL